jgi:NADH-quinone oxidoreductase subunit E
MVWESLKRYEPLAPSAALSDELRTGIVGLFQNYPTKRAALLPALHLVQKKLGCVPDDIAAQVAELLELTPAEVLDMLSFYDVFTRMPRGRHMIGVCESLSCELCGCSEILSALRQKLDITPGQTTPDGRFTLVAMQCLGACDFAPAVFIDETLHKNVTAAGLDDILRQVGA